MAAPKLKTKDPFSLREKERVYQQRLMIPLSQREGERIAFPQPFP